MTAELVPVDPDAGWHAWRSGGVGGSDAPVLLGLSSYASPVSLFFTKTGVIDDNSPDTQRQRIGKRMEAVLAAEFHDMTGLNVVGEQTWCEHTEHRWARCTVDGFVAESAIVDVDHLGEPDPIGIIEMKTVGQFAWPDGIPPNIRAQVIWQLGVTGMRHAWVIVVFAGWKVEIFEVDWDADAQADWDYVFERADNFWNQHVLAGIVPPMDDHDATTRALTAVFDADPEGMVDIDEPGRQLVGAVQVAQARTKAATADEARLKNELRAYLGDNTTVIDGWIDPGPRSKKPPKPNVLASWRPQVAQRFDTDQFKADHPDLASKYTKSTESRVLRVNKPKEGDQ